MCEKISICDTCNKPIIADKYDLQFAHLFKYKKMTCDRCLIAKVEEMVERHKKYFELGGWKQDKEYKKGLE